MLESIQGNTFEYEKLSQEEQQKRGILGRLKGIIADFRNPTRNGRKYGESLWDKVFDDPITQEKIDNRCLFGELEHPTDGRESIDPEKIAVCLAEKPKKDKQGHLVGVFDILNTACGQILKTLLDYGTTVGVSSRGSGDTFINGQGMEEVDPDSYNFTGFDVVLIPAVKTARMTPITESINGRNLRTALVESLNKADDKDKIIMKETLDNLGIDYSEDTNIIDVVKSNFGTVDDPYMGPTYILPDGSFLNLLGCGHHSDVEKYLIDCGLSSNEYIITGGSQSLYDLGCIRCDYTKYYIALCEKQPTRDQYNSLLVWLDDLLKTTKLVEVITPTNLYVVYKFEENISEDIVDRIRRYYISGMLYEGAYQSNLTDDIDVTIEDEDANNDGDLLVDELQNAILENQKLQDKIASLQEKLSVCYAKEFDYEDEISKYKKSLSKLSESVKTIDPLKLRINSLTEKLESTNQKLSDSNLAIILSNNLIKNLNSKISSLRESINEKKSTIKQLTESALQLDISRYDENKKLNYNISELKQLVEDLNLQIANLKKDSAIKSKQYLEKLENQNKLIEKYRTIAKTSVNKYIDSLAIKLGVNSKEITSRLNESYSFNDIDKVCDEILNYRLGLNNLPFQTNFQLPKRILVKESLDTTKPINTDDVLDDTLLSIVGQIN